MSERPTFEQETRERLLRMERELRRWRLGAMLGVPMMAVLLLGAMAEPPVKELRVQTLRIVDDVGLDRMVLTADREKPDMTFLDPLGQSRLTLDIADDKTPEFSISDGSHESGRLSLGVGNQGLPELRLSGGTNKRSVTLGVPVTGGPIIRLLNEKGELLQRLP